MLFHGFFLNNIFVGQHISRSYHALKQFFSFDLKIFDLLELYLFPNFYCPHLAQYLFETNVLEFQPQHRFPCHHSVKEESQGLLSDEFLRSASFQISA